MAIQTQVNNPPANPLPAPANTPPIAQANSPQVGPLIMPPPSAPTQGGSTGQGAQPSVQFDPEVKRMLGSLAQERKNLDKMEKDLNNLINGAGDIGKSVYVAHNVNRLRYEIGEYRKSLDRVEDFFKKADPAKWTDDMTTWKGIHEGRAADFKDRADRHLSTINKRLEFIAENKGTFAKSENGRGQLHYRRYLHVPSGNQTPDVIPPYSDPPRAVPPTLLSDPDVLRTLSFLDPANDPKGTKLPFCPRPTPGQFQSIALERTTPEFMNGRPTAGAVRDHVLQSAEALNKKFQDFTNKYGVTPFEVYVALQEKNPHWFQPEHNKYDPNDPTKIVEKGWKDELEEIRKNYKSAVDIPNENLRQRLYYLTDWEKWSKIPKP